MSNENICVNGHVIDAGHTNCLRCGSLTSNLQTEEESTQGTEKLDTSNESLDESLDETNTEEKTDEEAGESDQKEYYEVNGEKVYFIDPLEKVISILKKNYRRLWIRQKS